VSTVSELQSVRKSLSGNFSFPVFGALVLAHLVKQAMEPEAPQGSPDTIATCADNYQHAAEQSTTVAADLSRISTAALPSAWKGQVAETAAQAVQAVSEEVSTTQTVLGRAAQALTQWSQHLQSAQTTDARGLLALGEVSGQLRAAGLLASGSAIAAAQAQAIAAVNVRLAAAQLAQTCGTSTASLLNQLAEQARAERIGGGGLDALSSVVTATETNPGGDDILSANAMARASQRLDAMSPADRAAFEKLLADAKSPEESAYLLKALAAGHNLSQLRTFDAAIHPHGDDPDWLAMHLTPDVSSTSNTSGHYFSTYGGDPNAGQDSHGWDIYDQGDPGDCVAASTVVAEAMVDPTVMLQLTTGGTAEGDDSPAAFHQRLQDMYVHQYRQGQLADGNPLVYPLTDKGLGSRGETLLANQDLGSTTGSQYHYTGLDSTADRQGAVSHIEQSVDAGKPVPLDLTNGHEGHQVMIIGHDGDKLEIYNPWGYTTWVTESQFVNNDLGSLTTDGGDGSLHTADGVELPG